jgi:hypothetical protein
MIRRARIPPRFAGDSRKMRLTVDVDAMGYALCTLALTFFSRASIFRRRAVPFLKKTVLVRVRDLNVGGDQIERRARGPFSGYRMGAIDVPLLVRDLSLHGCLIELAEPVVLGRRITLQVHIPGEGWIAVRASLLRVRGSSWFAATFLSLDQTAREKLTRGIERSAPPTTRA